MAMGGLDGNLQLPVPVVGHPPDHLHIDIRALSVPECHGPKQRWVSRALYHFKSESSNSSSLLILKDSLALFLWVSRND